MTESASSRSGSRRRARRREAVSVDSDAVSSLGVDTDTYSEQPRSRRSSKATSTDTDFWEKRDSAEVVDLWEVDDDPQCGQLSDDGGEDIHGKPKPWNFVDDHATADDEHTGGGVQLVLRESVISTSLAQLYAGQLLVDSASAGGDRMLAGVVHWSDGSRYEGFWRRGMPSGWGVYQWSSGNKFHGEFRAGKRHGVGRFVWGATGEVYVGTWCQDQRDGHGLYTWQDGTRYEGQWRDGLREGAGMFHWMDGTRYEGQLANGNREGWGVMTNADNDKFRGLWEQGSLVTVTRFSTPECLSALEDASLSASRAWHFSLELESVVETAETAAQEAARQQTRALACYPPVHIIDFYERCEVLFGTGRARLEESSDDEVEDTKTISDTASLMGKLGFGKNSMLTKGLTAATDRMGSNLDSGLTSMSVFVDSHDGIQGAASALGSALGSGAYHMTSDGMSSVASMDMAKGRSLMRSMSNRIPSSGMSYTSKALSSIPDGDTTPSAMTPRSPAPNSRTMFSRAFLGVREKQHSDDGRSTPRAVGRAAAAAAARAPFEDDAGDGFSEASSVSGGSPSSSKGSLFSKCVRPGDKAAGASSWWRPY